MARKWEDVSNILARVYILLATCICLAASASSKAAPVDLYFDEICIIPEAEGYPAWVEIWNAGDTDIELKGHSLSTLQGRVFLFRESVVLSPDKRLLLLFYETKKPAPVFEAGLPQGVQKIRIYGQKVFPPFVSWQKWAQHASSEEIDRQAGDRKTALRRAAVKGGIVYYGTTRYRNELALVSSSGAIVSYAAWGDFYALRNTEEAVHSKLKSAMQAGLIKEPLGGKVPSMLNLYDEPGSTIQMYRYGAYMSLNNRKSSSPGLPQPKTVPTPRLHLPVLSEFRQLTIRCDRSHSNPEFEAFWGWREPKCDVFYDEEMQKRVFKPEYLGGLIFGWDNTIHVNLSAVDFFALSNQQLYCRLHKEHNDGRRLLSPVYEFTVKMDRQEWINSRVSTNTVSNILDQDNLTADRDAIARLLGRCNELIVSTARREKRWLYKYRLVNQGRAMELHIYDRHRRRMTDLKELAGFPIRSMDISESKVTDLSLLADMPLEELDISGTRITDVHPLAKCPLKVLNVTGTAITNLHIVADKPGIKIIQ